MALRDEMDRQQASFDDTTAGTARSVSAELEQLRAAVAEGRRMADKAAADHRGVLQTLRQSFEMERNELHATIRDLREQLDAGRGSEDTT